jgi:regulator of replication initiation timing
MLRTTLFAILATVIFTPIKALESEQQEKYDQALIYQVSFEQAQRKLALPILNELIAQGSEQAISLLARLELIGNLGYVSNQLFIDNYELIARIDSKAIENYKIETEQAQKMVTNSFSSLKRIYDNNYHLCEQPLDSNNKSLEKTNLTHLEIKYFIRCLEQYSVTNSKKRLLALSELLNVFCLTSEAKKVCLADGYKSLGKHEISHDNYLAIAAALRSILHDHQSHLKLTGNNNNQLLSMPVFELLNPAFNAVNENNHKQAIALLEEALQLPKLPAYDNAYIHRFLGSVYSMRAEPGDSLTAITYLEKALSVNQLSDKAHWETFVALTDLYFINEQYDKYINRLSNYIYDHQSDYDLLPEQTVVAINQLMNN